MSKADKYLKRLRDRCETLRARTGQQWEQELHALEWAIQRLEQPSDVQGEGFDQTALAAASMEVHKMLLREGSHWGTKACEEMGRTFMVAYRNALRDNSPRSG